MGNFFSNALKDLFSGKIFMLAMVPIIIAALLWGVIFWLAGGWIGGLIDSLISHIPYIGSWHWFQNSISKIGGLFLYGELLIITSVMLAGIVADKLVELINNKHYHNKMLGFGTLAGSIAVSLKQNIIYILLVMFLFPTFFIPIAGYLIHIILWYILIKKPLMYDSAALYANKDEYEKLLHLDHIKTMLLTLLSAAMFLLPVIGSFIYIFQLLVFAHYNLSRLAKIRK